MGEKLYRIIYRAFLLISFLLLSLAVLERGLLSFGYTLSFVSYGPGKLLEYAGIFALFTAVLLLRQIRDRLKK
jgi:hypothetical protein